MTCFVDSDAKIIIFSKNMLNSRFDMKEMGLVDVILGIKLIRIKESGECFSSRIFQSNRQSDVPNESYKTRHYSWETG